MVSIDDLHDLFRQYEKGALESDSNKLGSLRGRRLYLYGAGNIGRRLYASLHASGVEIAGFIDRNPHVSNVGIEVPIYLPDDVSLASFRQTSVVILSGLFPLSICEDIQANLKSLGFCNVYALHEVSFSEVSCGVFRNSFLDGSLGHVDVAGDDRSKIEEAFSLFEHDCDRSLFLCHLKAHLTMDFARLPVPQDISEQYLATDIEARKDYSRFVDCGGYDGDTFRQLIQRGYDIRDLVAFEPQNDLCEKYAKSVDECGAALDSAFLFPCGVYSKTTQLRFARNDSAQSSSRVAANGDDVIQCVKLDDALIRFRPTFIKMDIEGAEVAALEGARRIIEECQPGLAICVYHKMSDLWNVPCLISSIRPDYRYFIRAYNFMGLETVVYAFPK